MAVDVLAAPPSLVPLLGPLAGPAAYILALIAVFLLAFRGRRADRLIASILAAQWALMAVALVTADAAASGRTEWLEAAASVLRPGLMTWLAFFFALQALFFLVEGLRAGEGEKARLSFEPRASAGPVAGGLFLLYSLIVHPVLATLKVPGFPESVLGLSFHGVLFTFGILLFLERGFPRHILVLPLAWSALGGLAAFHPWPRDFGLVAGLLAGAFLALPRRKTVPDVEGNLRLETWYEHAARHHRPCGRTLLGLLLATCLIGFTRAAGEGPFFLMAQQLEISATLLAALLLVLWLSLPAWYSAGFRLLGWETGRWLRAGRRGWDWLTARWGGILLVLGLLVYAGWEVWDAWRDMKAAEAARAGTKEQLAAREEAEERTEKDLVLAAAALAMLYLIYQARQRIVISEFQNHTGEEGMNELAKGLASRLQNELAAITSLYRTIDEAMPPQMGTVVGVTVGVEDVVASLENVLSPETSVKLGKLELPVGLLFRSVSRLVGGPRLTGGLHREGSTYLVTADLSGGRGLSGSWRVSFADLAEEERAKLPAAPAGETDDEKKKQAEADAARATIYRMAEQLAYRIITSVGNPGSPRWEAVRSFTHGLRAYRGTQHVKGDASPELRAAEREFVQALSMDRNFSQCHYNLGVIYQALGVRESAEAAYRQVLSENPDWAEAYYALATVFFEEGRYDRSAIFARKMIEIRPGDARAWNLNGIARFNHRDGEARETGQIEQVYEGPAWDEIVQSFQIAAALAWRDLCRASLRVSSKSLSKETQLAVRCTNNLAIVKGDECNGHNRRTILEQSFRISPRDPRAHLVCGEWLVEEGQWHEARTELYKVFGDALDIGDHVERWLFLLGVHQAIHGQSPSPAVEADLKRSHASLLVHIAPPESLILGSGLDPEAEKEHREAYGGQLKSFETSLQLARRSLPPGIDPFDVPLAAIRFLRELEAEDRMDAEPQSDDPDLQPWALAQARIKRGRSLMATDPAEAAEEIAEAIRLLKDKGLIRQVEQQGLDSLLARAELLASRRRPDADLGIPARLAEGSVAQEPGSAARRWVLADAYSALGDFEEACNERETALRLGPGYEVVSDVGALDRIARDYLLLLGPREAPAPEPRVRRGLRFFERVLQIVQSRKPSRTRVQCTAHAAAHFWLGRFHGELGEAGLALDHLRIARSMKFRPAEVALHMGNLLASQKQYEEADRAFFESFLALRQSARESRHGRSDPLEVEAFLSWAMLRAERGVRLKPALGLCERARKRLPLVDPERRRELRALHAECVGWLHFQNGNHEKAIKELERAARLSAASSIQERLAKVYEAQGQKEKAAGAKSKAGAGNGHRNGVFGLWKHWPTPPPPAEGEAAAN